VAQNRLAGYAFLIEKYQLKVLPNWHTSLVALAGTLQSTLQGGQMESIYPPSYWPGNRTSDHLEFALKYDGMNLCILSALFKAIGNDELTVWIRSKPTGKYARRIWFLYEFLTEGKLPLPDLTRGNYIDLLESEIYYTKTPGQRVRRQRIMQNLLGGRSFCPLIRRTQKLVASAGSDLKRRCEDVVTDYSPELLRRALSFLYDKETQSSFEIEHIKPSASRNEKFVSLLEMAEQGDFCEKTRLIDVQNRIVDPRFRDDDYRTNQNYIGQTTSFQKQRVHYVCPKPGDIPEIMDGLIRCHQNMKASTVPAIVHAAVISYGFVFLHPFEDGNGRIHRFLIHNILCLRGVIPNGLMLPVSAAMLKNPALYDHSLEAFSIPLMQMVEYDLDDLGQMSVMGETGDWYRFMDMTTQVEALHDFLDLTIAHELIEELDFLASYDKTRQALQEIVDMPDRRIDLFIRLCLQNQGRLSANKRESHFSFLTDEELAEMEAAVRACYERS